MANVACYRRAETYKIILKPIFDEIEMYLPSNENEKIVGHTDTETNFLNNILIEDHEIEPEHICMLDINTIDSFAGKKFYCFWLNSTRTWLGSEADRFYSVKNVFKRMLENSMFVEGGYIILSFAAHGIRQTGKSVIRRFDHLVKVMGYRTTVRRSLMRPFGKYVVDAETADEQKNMYKLSEIEMRERRSKSIQYIVARLYTVH